MSLLDLDVLDNRNLEVPYESELFMNKNDCGCQMKTFLRLQNKFFEKLANFQAHIVEKPLYTTDGLKLPSKPLNTSVETQAFNLLNMKTFNTGSFLRSKSPYLTH